MTDNVESLAEYRSTRASALSELRSAVGISTSSDTRALAEYMMLDGPIGEDHPNFYHQRRIKLMLEMEDGINRAIRILERA